MSQGTCGQLGRNQGRGNDPEGSELPPRPTMAQVLMEVERNCRDSHHLLEVIACNTTQQRNEFVSLNDFFRLHPPVFSYSTEPLDADNGFAASRGSSRQAMLQMTTKSVMPPTTLRVQLAIGGRII